MTWQPIETAPKNGRYVWLGSPYHLRIGRWAEGAQYEHHGSIGGGWRDMAMEEACGVADLRFVPTHWMPLPTVPD